MKKEGTTMIIVPESIKRILGRTIEIYSRDLENHRSYNNSITVNGKTYTGTDTTRIRLRLLKIFKATIENGTNELLVCEKGKEDEAKIRLMYKVKSYFKPLSCNDISYIMNDVYLEDGLCKQIHNLSDKAKTHQEASLILEFFNNGYYASWEQEDAYYQVRDFRFVKSKKDFDNIFITEKNIQDFTPDTFTTIRICFVPMSCISIYKKKGIWEEYQNFLEAHRNTKDLKGAIDMFNLWHDVKERAIYYIYAPDVPK